MFIMKSFLTGEHIETIYRMRASNLFYSVIEAYEKDPTEPHFLSQMLINAVNIGCKEYRNENLPFKIAVSLKDEFERLGHSGRQHYGVSYAGVFLKSDLIQVCTAGDIRVHLLQNGKVINVTRDHNLIDDPPNDLPDWVKSTPKDVLTGALTRIIGMKESGEPEQKVWEVSGEYSVVVCTSHFHWYRAPEDYLGACIDSISGLAKTAYGSDWLFTKIAFSPSL